MREDALRRGDPGGFQKGRPVDGVESEDVLPDEMDIGRPLAREALGDAGYDARAAAFLAATTWPGSLMPQSARREAIDALVLPMYGDQEDNLVALGLHRRWLGSCAGLLRR